MHAPLAAAVAVAFQFVGWALQLLAVFAAMRAFNIHAPLPAAGLVLLLLNVATIFPLWPGNLGLYQAAVAAPLLYYGVATAHGVAFGVGLQAIEASVGIGIGMIFLAREGLTFATLKEMPEPGHVDLGKEAETGQVTCGKSPARSTRTVNKTPPSVPAAGFIRLHCTGFVSNGGAGENNRG